MSYKNVFMKYYRSQTDFEFLFLQRRRKLVYFGLLISSKGTPWHGMYIYMKSFGPFPKNGFIQLQVMVNSTTSPLLLPLLHNNNYRVQYVQKAVCSGNGFSFFFFFLLSSPSMLFHFWRSCDLEFSKDRERTVVPFPKPFIYTYRLTVFINIYNIRKHAPSALYISLSSSCTPPKNSSNPSRCCCQCRAHLHAACVHQNRH